MNNSLDIFDFIEGEYAIGIMFKDFRHHEKHTGKPTTKLLDLNGKHLIMDADLFYPLRNGLIVTQYVAGYMTGFSYLEAKDGIITGISKKPYGVLKNVKNEVCLPRNIAEKYIPILMCTGTETWFHWKMWIMDKNLLDSDNYYFDTLTTNQQRIPNVGVLINYGKETLCQKN